MGWAASPVRDEEGSATVRHLSPELCPMKPDLYAIARRATAEP